jgi:ABC-type Mn2+/Zn2+ transport system ATPase subunit
MVSHDMDQVRRLADTVTWIDRTVRGDGKPEDVLAGLHQLEGAA